MKRTIVFCRSGPTSCLCGTRTTTMAFRQSDLMPLASGSRTLCCIIGEWWPYAKDSLVVMSASWVLLKSLKGVTVVWMLEKYGFLWRKRCWIANPAKRICRLTRFGASLRFLWHYSLWSGSEDIGWDENKSTKRSSTPFQMRYSKYLTSVPDSYFWSLLPAYVVTLSNCLLFAALITNSVVVRINTRPLWF